MSVSSVGSNNELSYLQSLLQQGSGGNTAGISDPLMSLFAAFTGAVGGQSNAATASANTASPPTFGTCCSQFSPDTLGALISMQSQQTGTSNGTSSSLQSVFAKFDANGDGQISQAEFENAIGPNADKSRVDALFQKIDANGDGSISQDELTSAQNTALSHVHHHHHHTDMDSGDQAPGGPSGSGGLANLLDPVGATSQTANNADGSSTTTITYADGSSVSLSTPTPQSDGGSSASGSTGQNSYANLLEQLISWQSQLVGSTTNTISKVA